MAIKGLKAIRLRWMTLILALFIIGCSNTSVIRRGQDFYLGEPGVLITKDGENLNVRHTRVRDDSILVIDSRQGQNIQMPVSEARKLVVKRRGQAAWQGMFIAASMGAVLGAIPDPNCGDPCLFPNGGLVGGFFWAAAMAPVGALWGAILGSNRNYMFEQPAPVFDSISGPRPAGPS